MGIVFVEKIKIRRANLSRDINYKGDRSFDRGGSLLIFHLVKYWHICRRKKKKSLTILLRLHLPELRFPFRVCVASKSVCSSTCYATTDKHGKQPGTVCFPTTVMWSRKKKKKHWQKRAFWRAIFHLCPSFFFCAFLGAWPPPTGGGGGELGLLQHPHSRLKS